MKSNYKIRNKKLRTNFMLIIGIVFSTCLLSIGYAAINSMTLDVELIAYAGTQEGIFISDAKYSSNIDAEQQYSNVNSYIQTTLNTTIILSDSNPNSSITYEVSIFNNTDDDYFFEGTSYVENFYDNLGITYELEGIEKWDLLQAKQQIDFKITFKYLNNTLADSNELNSYIEFLFEPSQGRVVAELIYQGTTQKNIVSLDDGTTTFEVADIAGTVIRCNNSAIPALTGETISISGITTNITCKIFDTLEEAIETSDTSINNMLMISNEEPTFEDTDTIVVAANKKINLDLNGMTITASTADSTINYIENYGNLTVKNSKSSGYMQSNYRVIGNLENGQLTLESGTYSRTEEDTYCGGTITNFGGTVIIKNSTLNATSTAAFLNWGREESISLLDSSTFYTETGDAIINASWDSEISINNCTITSTSGAAFKGAYALSGGSDEQCGPIYICNSTVSAGNFDYYVPGSGRLYYASNVTFMNGDNTPNSNNSDSVIQNYTAATNYEWYKVKCKSATGQEKEAKYSDGKIIRIGDKVKISTLLSSNYVLDVLDGSFVNNQNVQLYTRDSVDAQEFMFLASALDGYYNISVYSVPTMALNINGSIQSGTNVDIYTYDDESYERFELIAYDTTNGNYNINSINDVYLDIEGKQAADSQNIYVYTPDGTDSQKWKIERAE